MNIIEAWAVRDCCMFELENIYNSFANSPIEQLIDESTWINDIKKEEIISLLEQLLEALEFTWDDKTTTQDFLKYLKK